MKLTLTNPSQWASNSNYETEVIQDCYNKNINLAYSPFPAFQSGNVEVAISAYKNPVLIKAEKIKIIVVNNDLSGDTHNYKYFLISQNNDLLIDSSINNKVWIKFFNIFNAIDNNNIDFLENNINLKFEIPSTNPLIFVGGQNHFGHWLVDHLTTILFVEKNNLKKNNFKYLTSKLDQFQIESLKTSGLNIDLLQIDIGKNYISLISVPEIYILSDLSIYKSYELLRSYLSYSNYIENKISQNKPKKYVYLERGTQRGLNRVVNEKDLIELLKEKNFDILKPHKLSLIQKKEIFINYDFFICPPGASYFNFYIFSKIGAHLIYCIHESALYNTDVAVYGGSYYQCPDLYRSTLIPSFQPEFNKHNIPIYDSPCYIDLDSINNILDGLI